MLRIIILIVLTAFTIQGCNNFQSNKPIADNKTIPVMNGQDKEKDNTGEYASVNGLKMYYEIYGAGTPLVLIHGGGSTIQTTFGRVLHSFAKKA